MICERMVRLYCKEDPSLIENYEAAVADKEQTWVCHHRDEIRTLPSGMTVYRSPEELIENGRYYNCPANELIFLTQAEHNTLHHTGQPLSEEARAKMSAAKKGKPSHWKGKTRSAEDRAKMSAAMKGKPKSEETRAKISAAMKGKPKSEETRAKLSAAMKGKPKPKPEGFGANHSIAMKATWKIKKIQALCAILTGASLG